MAMFRIWLTEADSWQIWTGFDRPRSSGPMTVAPPTACTSLVAMEAEWMAGITRTLASPVRRWKG